VRAVVDVNVLVSAALSAKGPSAEILRGSRDGQFELITSEMLLTELTRTLAYPRIRKRIPPEKAAAYVNWTRDHGHGRLADDPVGAPPVGSRDPDDDYLLALAIDQRAYLVTGDQDLLVLSAHLPILTSAQFAAQLRDTTTSD
jgi:predicted nucleic acid-binding protein